MTDAEWLASEDPMPMLSYLLRDRVPPTTAMDIAAAAAMRLRSGSGRKFRLYGCAWCRRFAGAEGIDSRLVAALDVAEHYADGSINESAFVAAKTQTAAAFDDAISGGGSRAFDANCALVVRDTMSLHCLPGWDPYRDQIAGEQEEWAEQIAHELGRYQSALLRDIFGNPFRPVTFSSAWHTDTAMSLARTMHNAREFSAMPILADSLQDAGCDNEDVLNHCRDASATHVRGCWVVDLVLGKE